MSNIEMKIKLYAKQNKMKIKKYDMTEKINTGNIDSFVNKIDEYVVDQNELELRSYELTKLKLENGRLDKEAILKDKEAYLKDKENVQLKLKIQLLSMRICQ